MNSSGHGNLVFIFLHNEFKIQVRSSPNSSKAMRIIILTCGEEYAFRGTDPLAVKSTCGNHV
jgi:hypothetical protein